ncbi:peroxiredoxin [Streptomyces sp. DW4-2]|uniref:Peroxiredoxin n=1 Tax=Streptomyces spirodelae TaxID=2812904 RepID=A0ABS3WT86_9ACTN|nr:peroxiredoxin [Streptomyces spirodelae]
MAPSPLSVRSRACPFLPVCRVLQPPGDCDQPFDREDHDRFCPFRPRVQARLACVFTCKAAQRATDPAGLLPVRCPFPLRDRTGTWRAPHLPGCGLAFRQPHHGTAQQRTAPLSNGRGPHVDDLTRLPAELPVPEDDGAADHLPGTRLPHLELPATEGGLVALDRLGPARTVLYVYPLTGRHDRALPTGWDAIPGARGCTPEACGFRDHHAELVTAGAAGVFGASSQSSPYQREVVERLRLPFALLSDPALTLATALGLPTFEADGRKFYRRLTLVVRDGEIEHVFYPVFPPDRHAGQVVEWLRANAV